jgi:hypothetical protein
MAPETRRAGRDQIAPVSHRNSIGALHIAQDQENPEFMEQDEDAEDRAESSDQAALGVIHHRRTPRDSRQAGPAQPKDRPLLAG